MLGLGEDPKFHDPEHREPVGGAAPGRRRQSYAFGLGVSQPAVPKHLRVLRDAGFVTCRTAARQRIYRLDPGPLRDIDSWLDPYRQLWTRHLDALERHLDSQEQ
ncbi:hypothetical protein DDE19_10875 [Micromonospora ureilytica]|uniref:HTH arsR-type domain-containing protein n=1 Tax=Micromonospora ureilytica TaxID=709868 RepID=A0A3N9YDY4_9ACTN|nr:hypothetical protein DDE19_10875 [Micromonospora ureilytica]